MYIGGIQMLCDDDDDDDDDDDGGGDYLVRSQVAVGLAMDI